MDKIDQPKLTIHGKKLFDIRKHVILLCLILTVGLSLASQRVKFDTRFYGVTSGLTSGNIRKILQDKYGFLWIATQDGLFRYDSKTFIAYNTRSDPSRQIGAPDVRNIQIDSTNNLLWACSSYGGINAIDLLTSEVSHHIPQTIDTLLNNILIKTFYVTGRRALLGSEKGLFLLDLQTNKLALIPLPGTTSREDVYVDVITEISPGEFLVLCRKLGAFTYNLEKNTVTRQFIHQQTINIEPPSQFYNFTSNTNGLICITSSQGLSTYRWKNGQLITDTLNSLTQHLQSLKGYAIRRACFDKKNHLWISTNKGLFLFDGDALLPALSNDERNANNDWLNAVYAIYVDMENNIWLGCQNGLAYVKNIPPPFITHSLSAITGERINHAYHIFPLNDSILYASAEEGLYKVNWKDYSITAIEKGKTYDFVFTDPFNRIIISNTDGLFVLNDSRKIPVVNLYREFRQFDKVRINSAIHINDSCIALGTENANGILIWNYKRRVLTSYTTKTKGISLLEDIVNSVYLLEKNQFLILSDASLSVFDYNTKTVKNITPKNKRSGNFYNIFFDANKIADTLFVACYGHGVLKLNNRLEIVGEITSLTGLSNNGVYKLLPWKNDLLVITTNNGLNFYYSSNGEIKSYYKNDGIHDNAFEETSGSTFNNTLFAGGTNGLTSIYPDRIQPNTLAPILYASDISIELPGKRKIDTSNLFAKEFKISRHALQTTLYFPCINYKNAERSVLKYKITELHKDWINLGNQNFIDLINFSPGTYHIEIQAFNEDNVGSEIKKLILIFEPKWYQTWWFITVMILAGLALIYTLYRLRIAQLKKEENIRRRLANDLHDDLGSTLNSIKVFSNLALMETDNHAYLIKIKESTQDAITGIRDIIWILDDKKDTVEHLLTRVRQFAAPLCEAANIRFEQRIDEDAYQYKLGKEEKRNLYMIIKEAINNSIKYAGCSQIELTVSVERKKLRIIIADNGKGFDTSAKSEGNGLRNMLTRSKEIHYIYSLESTPGKGTTTQLKKI